MISTYLNSLLVVDKMVKRLYSGFPLRHPRVLRAKRAFRYSSTIWVLQVDIQVQLNARTQIGTDEHLTSYETASITWH